MFWGRFPVIQRVSVPCNGLLISPFKECNCASRRYTKPYYLIMLYDLMEGGLFCSYRQGKNSKFHIPCITTNKQRRFAESSNPSLFRSTAFMVQPCCLCFRLHDVNSSVTPKSHKGTTAPSWRPGSFQKPPGMCLCPQKSVLITTKGKPPMA